MHAKPIKFNYSDTAYHVPAYLYNGDSTYNDGITIYICDPIEMAQHNDTYLMHWT